jgi:hypothetical protein
MARSVSRVAVVDRPRRYALLFGYLTVMVPGTTCNTIRFGFGQLYRPLVRFHFILAIMAELPHSDDRAISRIPQNAMYSYG